MQNQNLLPSANEKAEAFVGFYDYKLHTMTQRIAQCSTRKQRIRKLCPNDNEPVYDKTFLVTCQNRYCPKCFTKRYTIMHKRLCLKYRKLFYKRCIQLIFTTPRGFYTKQTKKKLEYNIYRFFGKLKKLHYNIIGIKCMDLTKTGHGTYLHCHSALRITFQLTDINKHILRQTWRHVTNNPKAVLKIKYSYTNGLLSYIAKRTVGMIEHQPNPKFLSDYMTIRQYFQTFYRSRYVTPIGICSNIAPNFKRKEPLICEKCGNTDDFILLIDTTEIIAEKPPPTLNNFIQSEVSV